MVLLNDEAEQTWSYLKGILGKGGSFEKNLVTFIELFAELFEKYLLDEGSAAHEFLHKPKKPDFKSWIDFHMDCDEIFSSCLNEATAVISDEENLTKLHNFAIYILENVWVGGKALRNWWQPSDREMPQTIAVMVIL